MTTVDERVSYIEGRLDSLATKEDLASLKVDLMREMGTQLKWLIGIQIGGLAVIAAILRLLGG